MKIEFTMVPHYVQPKHSTRFNFERLGAHVLPAGSTFSEEKFKPSFYIPKPVGEGAKRIRVTIEVVE
jgi:hypothetical protein